MHVVLINGPAGSGKNTLATQMRTHFFSRINNQAAVRKLMKYPVSSISIEEHKQPLINMLFAFAESLSLIPLFTEQTEATYAQLKNMNMLGRTGREWQIIWADAMRAADSNIFIDSLHKKISKINPDIALIPDCGFEDEYRRAVMRFGERNVTLIYLDGWRGTEPKYRHLDRFANDIRICLRDSAQLVQPSVPTAVSYVLGRMEENAKQQSLDF